MKRKYFLSLAFLCLAIQTGKAQKKEIGIFFGFHAFQLTGGGVVDKFQVINNNYANLDGSHIGGYYRHFSKNNKFFLQGAFQFTNNWESTLVINNNPIMVLDPSTNNLQYELSANIFGTGYRRIEMPLTGGVSLWKPLTWIDFRASAGIKPTMLFVKKNEYVPGIGLRYLPLGPALENNTFHRFGLDYQVGLGLVIWNITLDATYSSGITRMSSYTTYQEEKYIVRQRGTQFFVSLGYKINLNKSLRQQKRNSKGIE